MSLILLDADGNIRLDASGKIRMGADGDMCCCCPPASCTGLVSDLWLEFPAFTVATDLPVAYGGYAATVPAFSGVLYKRSCDYEDTMRDCLWSTDPWQFSCDYNYGHYPDQWMRHYLYRRYSYPESRLTWTFAWYPAGGGSIDDSSNMGVCGMAGHADIAARACKGIIGDYAWMTNPPYLYTYASLGVPVVSEIVYP